MSSTNRGMIRAEFDYYQTPLSFVKKFFLELEKLDKFNFKYFHADGTIDNYNTVLDPCAGGGPTSVMSFVEEIKERGGHVDTIDIREDSLADIKADFLTYETDKKYDLVISNPPFVEALPFVKKSLELTNNGGWVMMLLRLNFLESKGRFQFWKECMPRYIFVNSERLSFTPDGKSDSVAHAMFCWQKGFTSGEFSEIKVI